MAKKKQITTNAMRMLTAAGIEFEKIEYGTDTVVSEHFGEEIAKKTGIEPERSFKTLVAKGDGAQVMVVCINVNSEVNLKKLASASKNKKVELIGVKELLPLTGYIRGGVSPIGMKKNYPTYIEKSCLNFEKVAISAGICGATLLLKPQDLIKMCNANLFEN